MHSIAICKRDNKGSTDSREVHTWYFPVRSTPTSCSREMKLNHMSASDKYPVSILPGTFKGASESPHTGCLSTRLKKLHLFLSNISRHPFPWHQNWPILGFFILQRMVMNHLCRWVCLDLIFLLIREA